MLIYSMSISVDGFIAVDIALDLIETGTFGSRVIYERYGRARGQSS
jgi:hypothetical protein